MVKMDNSTAKRQELAQRLITAGCSVNIDGTDWHTAGNLNEALIPYEEIKTSTDSLKDIKEKSLEDISGQAMDILIYLAGKNNCRFSKSYTIDFFNNRKKMTHGKILYFFDILLDEDLINLSYDETEIYLTPKGRKYLAEKGLI